LHQRFPFPGGEIFLLPLHTEVKNVSTNLTAQAPPAVLQGLSQFGPFIARSGFKKLIDLAIGLTEASPQKHNETTFTVVCKGAGTGGKMSMEITGKDPYFLTAKIISRCAIALQGDEVAVKSGAASASMIQGGRFIRAITEDEGVSWSLRKDE